MHRNETMRPASPRQDRARKRAMRYGGMPVLRRLLALALMLSVQHLWAQCSINIQSVSFGGYDVFNSQPTDGIGSIGVTCNASASYTISLSAGGGSYSQRLMASGAYRLGYNLFIDASRTSVWGDGTAGTAVLSGNGTAANHTVYGRIPARQNAHVGSYSDSIVVTLTY